MRVTGLIAAVALSACAAAGAIAAAPNTQEAPLPPERKICRTEKATGSLTRRTRICLTAAQWRELNARTRRGVDEMQGSASGAGRCISAMDQSCGAPGPGGPGG